MRYIVYILTRDDGKQYIGTTIDYRYKNRMCQHRCSKRFDGHSFTHNVLVESKDVSEVLRREAELIHQYNTMFPAGLNLTWSGKGKHHNSSKFTTRGYKFSDESRKKRTAKCASFATLSMKS